MKSVGNLNEAYFLVAMYSLSAKCSNGLVNFDHFHLIKAYCLFKIFFRWLTLSLIAFAGGLAVR